MPRSPSLLIVNSAPVDQMVRHSTGWAGKLIRWPAHFRRGGQ
jgi:hypothetical protein